MDFLLTKRRFIASSVRGNDEKCSKKSDHFFFVCQRCCSPTSLRAINPPKRRRGLAFSNPAPLPSVTLPPAPVCTTHCDPT